MGRVHLLAQGQMAPWVEFTWVNGGTPGPKAGVDEFTWVNGGTPGPKAGVEERSG